MPPRVFLLLVLFLQLLKMMASKSLLIKNNRIYDQNGGERIFHGVNINQKRTPYYDNITEQQLKTLKKNGINGIRLGVMWAGVQPHEDGFDQQYLKKMVGIVNSAGMYNISTLIEFHQDLFSQKFCGNGVPIWAVPREVYKSFPIPVMMRRTKFDKQSGLPPHEACLKPWGEYYFTKAVNKGFGHLWKNKHGLLDKLGNYWKKVAETFKDNPYVIGYELINQPWPGNMYVNPIIMLQAFSQIFHLQDAYDYLSHEIRKVDQSANICYQPVTWLNGYQSGFIHPPGGKRFQNSSIFCYHYYKPPTLHLQTFMEARMSDVRRLGGAGMLTEFNVTGEDGRKNVAMMELCDNYSQSWFGWAYLDNHEFVLIPEIRRSFSHRVAGSLINQYFNHQTKQYWMMYKADPKAGETIIYLNIDSIDDMEVQIYPTQSKAKYNIIDGLYLSVNSSQFRNGGVVMIIVKP